MILKISHSNVKKHSPYIIDQDDRILYQAEPSHRSEGQGLSEHDISPILTDAQGKLLQSSIFEELEKEEDTDLPKEWLAPGSSWKRYHLKGDGSSGTDSTGNLYFEQRGIPGHRIVLEREGILMCGYMQYDGSREVVSFYVGKVQVGQLVRPVAAMQEDYYWLHMLDLYEPWLPLLAHFTVIYDERRRRKNSDVQKSANLIQILESAQNQEYYHRDFVEKFFGSEEHARLEAMLNISEEEIQTDMADEVRKRGRWVILGWAVVLAVLLAILWIIGL